MRMGQNLSGKIATKTAFLEDAFTETVAEAVEEGFFTVDQDLRLLYVEATPNGKLWSNGEPALANQEKSSSRVGQNLLDIFTGSLRTPMFAAYKRLLQGENTAAWEAHVDGHHYIFRTFSIDGGFATYYCGMPKDAKHDALQLKSTSGANATAWATSDIDNFFQHSADIICLLDENARFERINPAAERLLGSDILEKRTTLFDLIHPEEQANAERLLFPPPSMLSKEDGGDLALLCRCRGASGEYRWLQWSISVKNQKFYASARDISVMKAREEEMSRQVQHDPLTGLPNRLLLLDRLNFCLAAASRRRHGIAVLFLDLDRFKKVNDTFGHPAGDQLLSEIAELMSGCLRDEDMVARLGGDEFVVILPHIREPNDAVRVAHKLLSRFVQPFQLRGNQVMLSVSIGIALAPKDGQTAEELIQHADDAMYRAKQTGRGTYALYDASLSKTKNPLPTAEHFTLEARLSQALTRQELLLHYQPQVDLKRGRVIGVEALMRWHPDDMDQQISPAQFIPVAEDTGLIIPLGNWAVHEACRQAVDWYRSGFPVQMSVNLSAVQLSDRAFPDKLNEYLSQVGLPAELMDLELTEGTFIHHDEKMIEVLNRLRDLGLHLSVDDFGTKYSWLSYLRRFPIDGVKVDRSFVTSIAENSADEAVVKAIIDLSHTLGLKVIAEGVETTDQRDCLLNLGCDIMQGHLFSAAVPPGELTTMLRQNQGNHRRG